jgi:hypothetical protein
MARSVTLWRGAFVPPMLRNISVVQGNSRRLRIEARARGTQQRARSNVRQAWTAAYGLLCGSMKMTALAARRSYGNSVGHVACALSRPSRRLGGPQKNPGE